VRGGHRFQLRPGNHRLDFGTKTLANHFGIHTAWQRVDLKAGDFLAFDSRLPHRSTLLERGTAWPQPKYVIYWSCRTTYATRSSPTARPAEPINRKLRNVLRPGGKSALSR
jgi:hypothetical protein